MNKIISDNITVCSNESIIQGGIKLPMPSFEITNSAVINGKIFINGREFKNGKWRRTIRALWHMMF